MAWLVVSLGSRPVLAIPVGRSTLHLGRAPGNDIVLPLPEVADHHATLTVGDDGPVLVASAEETLVVGGRPVSRATLAAGQSVAVGGYRLRWVERDDAGDLIAPESGSHSTLTHGMDGEAASRDGMPVRFVRVVAGKDAGLEEALDGSPFVIGRAPDCGMVLHDETVSWRHLSLEQTADGLKVRDLGSRNGTFMQGQRIEAAFAESGSRVRAGRTTLELASGAGADRQAGAPARALAELVGRSQRMLDVYERIRNAAAGRVSVLLQGETGTGKELAARAIHSLGPRSQGPFISLNCTAVPHHLLEDELFGHARGAYSGAEADRQGAFASAHKGTIFLDEIGELPMTLQPMLLRVLETGEVPRIGGGGKPSDFRVVTATNRDLAREVEQGRFRRDLFFRLKVMEIRMPPLADHIEDLADLVHHFLAGAEESTGIAGSAGTRLAEEAMAALREHPWPGNVRELRNVIHGAVVRRPGGVVDRALVDELVGRVPSEDPARPTQGTLEEAKRDVLRNTLEDLDWNVSATARRLGISPTTVYDLMRKFDLKRPPRR